ncbi:hypothetical protein GCM10025866_36050 [Naasia aerilata]|uniref:Uncharacterized protein n=1 Tax=Naasia aerilata TaxID=1162966 RepID=A0ABM8GH70_9MICO|nr:hypothetical protein GCM10025866_36050 [Naasia aerilata]
MDVDRLPLRPHRGGVRPRGGPADSVRHQAQVLYLHRVQPRAKAIANIDNTDPEHPRRTFSDSC